MAEYFNFVGKIALGKETEKFHPIDRKSFSSGWMNTTVKFSMISGTNRIPVMAQGGRWKDENKNVVRTFSKTETKNGQVVKGTVISIPWNKRFDEDEVDKVAGFKKSVVKLNDDEEYEFITEWDFAEYLANLLSDGNYKNSMFHVSGTYDVQYSHVKKQFYTNYRVNKVEVVDDDREQKTELKATIFVGEDCIDDSSLAEDGKAYLNCWIKYYDNSVGQNGFYNMPIVLRENAEQINFLKEEMACNNDEIKEIGVVIKVINGSEREEITLDKLDDRTRRKIELGLTTFEEQRAALGGTVAGNVVNELRFDRLWAGKDEAKDTAYTMDDMHEAREKDVALPFDLDDDEDDI